MCFVIFVVLVLVLCLVAAVCNGEGGGYKTGGGGHLKFYPYEKRGGGKGFSHAEGGWAQQVFTL